MKCKTCREDVPPKFAHALSVNICPLCGKEIMDVKLQAILGELKSALTSAKDYSEEVEDWLFSTFSFKKISSNEIVVNKNQLQKEAQASPEVQALLAPAGKGTMVRRSENPGDDIVVDEGSTVFAQRAGVHKKAVDFIKGKASFGAADPSEFTGVDDEYGDVSTGTNENINPLNRSEQNQMHSLFGGTPDLGDTSQELRMQKLKRLQSQHALESGGGKFRRA